MLACLCKPAYAKISKDTYIMNFCSPWKQVEIKNWAQFTKLMLLKVTLDLEWPVEVNKRIKLWMDQANKTCEFNWFKF